MKRVSTLLIAVALMLTVLSGLSFAESTTMEDRIAEINNDASITVTTAILDETSPTGA